MLGSDTGITRGQMAAIDGVQDCRQRKCCTRSPFLLAERRTPNPSREPNSSRWLCTDDPFLPKDCMDWRTMCSLIEGHIPRFHEKGKFEWLLVILSPKSNDRLHKSS